MNSYQNYVNILHSELVCALGCTEPIAVAYAAALARRALKTTPEHITVVCSGNIIKNVKSVTVPNSGGMRGIEAAATLGVVGGDETCALEVLEHVTPEDIKRTHELLDQKFCTVELKEGVPNLYVSVIATSGSDTSVATIAERHTSVVELKYNDEDLTAESSCPEAKSIIVEKIECDRSQMSLRGIWDFIHEVDTCDIEEPIERQITYNQAISEEGLKGNWGAHIGKTLLNSRPDSIDVRARAAAAAGSDARMSGCPLPVVIVCGSGNQGMTCVLPVVEYGKHLGVDHGKIIRAVALSDLVAVHVKHYIGELSAFCGAVSAACGAAGAICYLRDGSFTQFEGAIVNTIANVGGIVCDGAKPSCAAKIASAIDAAILGCDMAVANDEFRPGDGLVGADAEETIRSMGYVGRVGMHPTDIEILNIMIGKTDTHQD